MLQEATRICAKCGESKPLSAYYKSRKKDCADCVKIMANEYRQANLDAVRAHDRERGQLESRKEGNRRRYRKAVADPDLKAVLWKRSAGWRANNSLKRSAHVILNNAMRRGSVVRPETCSACGENCVPHGHHEDYMSPLDVVWLCKPCHGKRHREINALLRAGVDLSARGF